MRSLECLKSAGKVLHGNSRSKNHHNTELWTQSTENRWNSIAIFHTILGACPWSPKVHERNGRTRTIPRTNHLHVDVQWHHIGTKDNETECIAHSTLVSLFSKKISSRTLVTPRTWIRNKVVFYLQRKNKKNGIESLNRWWSISEKADTQFSEQRVQRSKAKEVEKYLFTSAPMGIRLKLFFAESFL